jgi:predicted anti-sigma-YlaC factor YlaD
MTEHLHSNCDALLQSLSDLLDDELSEEMCREIQQHLETCGNCRAVFNTTRRTIDLVRLPPDEPSRLPDDVRERLFKRLDLDDLLKQHGA